MRLDVPNAALLGGYLLLCLGWYLLTRRRERAIALFRRLRGAPAHPVQSTVTDEQGKDTD